MKCFRVDHSEGVAGDGMFSCSWIPENFIHLAETSHKNSWHRQASESFKGLYDIIETKNVFIKCLSFLVHWKTIQINPILKRNKQRG